MMPSRLKECYWEWRDPYPYRSYFKKRRCIFIHIPKCAGTSVLSSLSDGGVFYRDHATWLDYKLANPKRYQAYYKFAFVRNPWDRLVSTYHYLASGGNKTTDLWLQEIMKQEGVDFRKFIMQFITADMMHTWLLLKPQHAFVCNYKNEIEVDFLGRFETIGTDFGQVSTRLNIHGNLPKINQSHRAKYQDLYTDTGLVDRVYDLYGKDIDLFGYSFD